ATESMAGTEGQCPTCGLDITIPILDSYGRVVEVRPIKHPLQDPHPVHAYAASGKQAPRIVRLSDGAQHIQCPRCGTFSAITSDNCRACGRPFTIEGTIAEGVEGSNGYAVASLVLGILSLPTFCTGVVPLLAIVFGLVGYQQSPPGEGGGRGMAVAGMICGGISLILAFFTWFG
ncbi:MAG: DUF4190 domain-containing protein, partial [Phycisphaerae bacterium]|nr:DUF4190 domain-containing protein [Phycisphaerae bacterium]MDW8261653.1 DUF4190 domain-containing protein [Phycisphaerales bacterium]